MTYWRFHYREILSCGIILLLSFSAFCQNLNLIDSLKNVLRLTPIEQQFDVLNAIGFEYRYSFPDSTILYCSRAYELGKRIKVEKLLARPLNFIGLAKANQGDNKGALDYQNRAMAVSLEQNDTIQLAHGFNNVGRIFFDEGDLVRAYENFVKSKTLFEKIHDRSGLAYVYRSLATLFIAKKDFTKALENSEKSLALRKGLRDPRAITSAHIELGLVYKEMDNTPQAIRQFEAADSIATSVNDKITRSEIELGIAEILLIKKRIKEAGLIADAVLKTVSEKTNQKIYLRGRLLLAKCKMEDKEIERAIAILNQVFESSEKSGNIAFQREAAFLLSKAFANLNKPFRAMEYYEIYQIRKEKIQHADLNKEIERLQFQLQIEKTEKENESLKARQAQDESLIGQQRLQNLLLIISSIIGTLMTVFIWRISQKRKVINQKLEDQNLYIDQQREEITRQNEILSRRNRELDEINDEKNTLMNIVVHDLKSPINRISGLVHILEMEGNLNSNQLEYVRLVKESTRGGLALITDLLDVQAWEEQRENPVTSVFQFDEFLKEKVESFRVMAEAKRILIRVESKVDQKIVSSPSYLGRIVDNLVSNAVKFSRPDSTVDVKGTWKNDQLYVSVKDAGPGFTDDDQKQLFQKFKKLSARPTAGESSNGLGLAIVKILVDRLRGTIELKTAVGKGSEFLIRIPAEIFQQVPA